MRGVRARRFSPLAAALAVAACTPSAVVRKTAPIADLQYYRTVSVRGGAQPQAQAWAELLASTTATKLGQYCKFERVDVGEGNAA